MFLGASSLPVHVTLAGFFSAHAVNSPPHHYSHARTFRPRADRIGVEQPAARDRSNTRTGANRHSTATMTVRPRPTQHHSSIDAEGESNVRGRRVRV